MPLVYEKCFGVWLKYFDGGVKLKIMKGKTKEKTKKPKFPIPHYVCIGSCDFVSSEAGKCLTPSCWRHRNPLTECQCKNGKHTKIFKIYNPEKLKKKVYKNSSFTA